MLQMQWRRSKKERLSKTRGGPRSGAERFARGARSIKIAAGVALLSMPGCLADLRPTELRNAPPSSAAIERGRAILKQARLRAGDESYRRAETLRLVYRDEWRGSGEYFNWWPTTPQRVEAYFVTDSFTSQHRLLDGPGRGEIRGVQNWRSYRTRDGETLLDDHPEISFYLPTLHYFLELPYRIDRAPHVVATRTETWDGETYDLVFVTWGASPADVSAEYDQYELWVARSTGRIEIVHYTVRETIGLLGRLVALTGQAKGTIYYSDFRDVAGLQIPFRQTVTIEGPGELRPSALDENFFHRLTIEEASVEAAGAGGVLPFVGPGPGGDHK